MANVKLLKSLYPVSHAVGTEHTTSANALSTYGLHDIPVTLTEFSRQVAAADHQGGGGGESGSAMSLSMLLRKNVIMRR